RFTPAAISYNVSYAVRGGTAPFVGTWLVGLTGVNTAPASIWPRVPRSASSSSSSPACRRPAVGWDDARVRPRHHTQQEKVTRNESADIPLERCRLPHRFPLRRHDRCDREQRRRPAGTDA